VTRMVVGSTAWLASVSLTSKLCLAIGILRDASERAGATRKANGISSLLDLTQCERDVLSALGADEFKPDGIHRAAFPHSGSDYLTNWINILFGHVSDLISANVKSEPRAWLAQFVLLGARTVTAMLVGSTAWLGSVLFED